jgi:multiple sugar transport system ATP-binding protein
MTLADRIAIMKDGIIQQFDTPQAVYDNPANLFTAGFIGSPSMNFIPCQVTRPNTQTGVALDTGNGKSYFLPLERSGLELDAWVNHEVILGIRPEKISHGFVEQEASHHIHEIESTVEVLEPTGPDTMVSIRLNNTKVTCRINPDHAKAPGETIRLMVDLSKAILFDPRSERKISPDAA